MHENTTAEPGRLKTVEELCVDKDIMGERIKVLKAHIAELEAAINAIAPWLSASLDAQSCQEYAACVNEVLRLALGPVEKE